MSKGWKDKYEQRAGAGKTQEGWCRLYSGSHKQFQLTGMQRVRVLQMGWSLVRKLGRRRQQE